MEKVYVVAWRDSDASRVMATGLNERIFRILRDAERYRKSKSHADELAVFEIVVEPRTKNKG